MEYVTILAVFNGQETSYNVPAHCRYFAASQLVEMGAESIQIGKAFFKAIEMAIA